jgi:hypothetical protein
MESNLDSKRGQLPIPGQSLGPGLAVPRANLNLDRTP